MSESITVEWDSAGTGAFGTEITDYVMSIEINRGRQTDLEAIGSGTATLVLKNHDGRFSPDYAGGAYHDLLEMYRRVRIKGTVGASTYGIFYGYLLGWDNKPRISEQTVTWYLGDKFALWERTLLNLPLLRKVGVECALDLAISRAMGTNECDNPSVETDLTGYSGLQSVTPVRDATMKIEGDYTVLCDCPGDNAGEGWRFDATGMVNAGFPTPIFARIWAKASETVTLKFRAYDSVAGERYSDTVSVGTTATLLSFIAVLSFAVGSSHYFDLYTNAATEVMFWSDGLFFYTPPVVGKMCTRDLDVGTAEIELAASYRRPALEVLQAIAQSEPRSFFFSYCGDTNYDERLRFYDLNHRSAASSATFSDDDSDVPYANLVYNEQADDRISEAEVTSAGTYEDANELMTIWELSPTGYLIPATESMVFHAQYSQPAYGCALVVATPPTSFTLAQEADGGNLVKIDSGTPATNGYSLKVGMTYTGGHYYRWRSYIRFDTSPIPDAATLVSATLRVWIITNRTDQAFYVNVRDAPDWYTLDATDWTKGDGEDLLGSRWAYAGLPAEYCMDIDIDVAGIDKAGISEFRLASDRDEDSETPVGAEWLQFYGFTADKAPILFVEYEGGAFATIALDNYGVGGKITLTAGALDAIVPDVSITGYPLKGSSEESKVVHASAAPPAIERTLTYALPLQGTRTTSMETEAERLADHYDGQVRRISLTLVPKTDTILTQMLAREIGDKVHVENVNDPFSSWIDADFWVEGIEHRIVPGVFHETVFHLEEA